jgi:hypothetical protein
MPAFEPGGSRRTFAGFGVIDETLPPTSLASLFFSALPVVLRGDATGPR